MGRSSQEQAALNRERIVAAASGLFRLKGIENVTISDIMKAAGMTAGGFYKHFESKEALVLEAVDDAFKNAVEAWLNTSTPKKKADGAGVTNILKYYFKPKTKDRSCPIMAYGHRVSHTSEDNGSLPEAYSKGAEALFDTFMQAADGLGLPKEKLQLLFAAMVGANLLASATNGSAWARDLQKVVLSAGSDAGAA